MDERALAKQIEETEAAIARAEDVIAKGQQFEEEMGISGDLFADVLASDNFTDEFKQLIRDERAKVLAKMQAERAHHTHSRSSKITARKGVTRI